jgi:serine/threonine-protein kinase
VSTRWETVSARPGRWLGRVTLLHDPSLEEDGLLVLARIAMLRAVPALFGWSDAEARHVSTGKVGAAGPLEPPPAPGASPKARSEALVQDFEVAWSTPHGGVLTVIGGAAGLAVGAAPMALQMASGAPAVSAAVAGVLAGVFVAQTRVRDGRRKVEARAQGLRVAALERSLHLRDLRERELGAHNEGAVVAGQFKLLRRMGAGATGVIYEAIRISDRVRVAIKLLKASAAHEAVASDRLRREAEALGLAWHPNVVEVLDHGLLADGTAYLVMELLEGETLASRLATRGHLRPDEVLPIGLQVCDALAAVHAAGIVHRDLKPNNVYLSRGRDGSAERVKLLDFGIARVEWEETRITHTGGPVGTPGYMSPEQENGSGEVDGRSDLFALGAMLYECLTGEPPPSVTGSALVGAMIKRSERVDSGTQRAAQLVPTTWRVVIDKAMAVQPADRYADAREFAQALRNLGEENASLEASS